MYSITVFHRDDNWDMIDARVEGQALPSGSSTLAMAAMIPQLSLENPHREVWVLVKSNPWLAIAEEDLLSLIRGTIEQNCCFPDGRPFPYVLVTPEELVAMRDEERQA